MATKTLSPKRPKPLRHGAQLFDSRTHQLLGVNVGSVVRPDFAWTPMGQETIQSFLSRGGKITKGRPALAGMNTAKIRVKGASGRGYVQRAAAAARQGVQ